MSVDAPWHVPNMIIRRNLQIPAVKEEIFLYGSQYSPRLSISKLPKRKPHGAIRQQAIAKTPAK
jgi:hypothetical protein